MEVYEEVSCDKCGMHIGTFRENREGRAKKNAKLDRHYELYHSGKYKQDDKGNFVKVK